MGPDIALTAVTTAIIAGKLADLAVRTVRQFYARFKDDRDKSQLRRHLGLDQPAFDTLIRAVEQTVRTHFPQDLAPPPRPPVNRSGVAVHRLTEPGRPQFEP